ncbi:MAG TPA: four helix bundle protein [Chitinophagales bacterium]|nr:four helix bundle protein [Chitinophagales bacterium]
MEKSELKNRTKRFGINTIKFVDELPNSRANNHIAGQLIRSSTSVGANYRAALRGKSNADFLNKIKIIEEEADECIYWYEILEETNNKVNKKELIILKNEANELTAIFTAIVKTLKSKNQK